MPRLASHALNDLVYVGRTQAARAKLALLQFGQTDGAVRDTVWRQLHIQSQETPLL